ncbi:DUF3108 domain-containing protein [Mucilaginibacter sp. E4BP6]|uniref:DUF3108 domain-containing protein n=1 Tax=Mucilaginibacter sp. E4BP6 TaxID=2723089 RepID=UPI0015C87DC1|nr:DUF3108 domain-containing protein [Mucilaginibacter sp. E4BP6]NYE66688.1 hypothetical protein [Mucilaginibacter sp. E4BP6]
MKKYLLTLLLIISCVCLKAQELTMVNEPVFKVGEQLSYRLKYGFFTAAEADLKVENTDIKYDGHPAYHIVVEGKTAGSFDVFYKVRNRYESYVDQKTLLPYYYAENRHEGSWNHSDKVTFNHETDKITANKGTYPYTGKVFDFVSAYYFARTIDISKMHVGDKFELKYFLDDGINSLGITYVGKERVTCSMGTFNCLKFNPTIIPGRIFKKNSKLYLWITDDDNRIPVKAQVEVILGSITMDLTGAKGLKFPLNAIKN